MIIPMQKLFGSGIELKKMVMEDPTFFDETSHVAHIIFQNPKGVTLNYTAELYLGKTVGDKKATSGQVPFSVSAGGSQTVDFTVTMPRLTVQTDTYHVYCSVSVGGTPIITYISTEDVVVNVNPAINITKVTWD
jgi:hypothetical protein